MAKIVIKKRGAEEYLAPGKAWSANVEDAIDFNHILYALVLKIFWAVDGEIVCLPKTFKSRRR